MAVGLDPVVSVTAGFFPVSSPICSAGVIVPSWLIILQRTSMSAFPWTGQLTHVHSSYGLLRKT